MKVIPTIQYMICIIIPTPIPKLVIIACFLPLTILCLNTTAKSGPGLKTANKCIIEIERNCSIKNGYLDIISGIIIKQCCTEGRNRTGTDL